jgi:hypothetical protein
VAAVVRAAGSVIGDEAAGAEERYGRAVALEGAERGKRHEDMGMYIFDCARIVIAPIRKSMPMGTQVSA